jgi:hypothetical protein
VHVQTEDGREAVGRAADTDVIQASAAAYLNAINRLLVREQTEAQRDRVNGV